MRTGGEYLEKAAEFDLLAAGTHIDTLKTIYARLAYTYRILANERKRLIKEGVIEADPPQSN